MLDMLQALINFIGRLGRFAPRQPNTWDRLKMVDNNPKTGPTGPTFQQSDRADRIAAVSAALRKDADSHGTLSAHLVTNAVILECATVAVDAIAAYENAKVI